jgi:hypothetical protein
MVKNQLPPQPSRLVSPAVWKARGTFGFDAKPSAGERDGLELLCHMRRRRHLSRLVEASEKGRDDQPRTCEGEVILIGIERDIAVHVAALLSLAKDVLGIHERGIRQFGQALRQHGCKRQFFDPRWRRA